MLKSPSIIFLFIVVIGVQGLNAQQTINTMFYNLLNFSEAPPTNRGNLLNNILATYQPDLFMVAELQSPFDRDIILNNAFNYTAQSMVAVPFVFNTSSNFSGINQLVFYDEDKLTLTSSHQIQTNIRDINHYTFTLNTTQNETLEVFVAHFKAAQGEENVQERLNEANAFISYASANLTADSNVLFAGDFNFYNAQEPGFQTILFGTPSISFIDPINRLGDWNSNVNFQDVHTQSTRTSNNDFEDFGAGGGLDDRFDFIFLSENMNSQANSIRYVDASYKTYGNNSNCYNNNINSSNCTGEYSQSLRDLLYNVSDHLPVVLQLETDSNFLPSQNFQLNNSLSFFEGNVIRDQLQLKIDQSIIHQNMRIYNQGGQLVKRHTIQSEIESLNCKNLSTGLYYIKIEGLDGFLKFFKSI